MNSRVLYLAWQDKVKRQWFPVGRLDVSDSPSFSFSYLKGAERAKKEGGFEALYDFPDLYKKYESSQLFPLFKNRVLTKGRNDFEEYLSHLDLNNTADPIEILSVDGGLRVTDSFEVFPEILKVNGMFKCKFFVHGVRYVNEFAQERINTLESGEVLKLSIELTNPVTKIAIQLQTGDYHVIGWTPRYLVNDLVHAISHDPEVYEATVVKVNLAPAPVRQRVLVELMCKWPTSYKPMEKNEDFSLLTS